ncbi:MAG: hypothetical protein GZ089_08470 [Aromatoleum sp.]|nr:hypothetical protein [Aromatoleum sp.]
MQQTPADDEARRTAALALWRYGHDYLKAAQALCEHDRIACNDSQALYHLAAQGIEFSLKSYLRVKGVAPADLNARIGHSLLAALQDAIARGLPPPPAEIMRAIQFIAPYHGDEEFRHLAAGEGTFPDLAPLLSAGTWVLDQIASEVVADHFASQDHGSPPEVDDMARRMRGDLAATVSKIEPPQ